MKDTENFKDVASWTKRIEIGKLEDIVKENEKSRKTEIIIIAGMLVVCVLFIFLMKLSKGGTRVAVSVGGNEYGSYSLNRDQQVEIKSENGTNVLQIMDGQANMIEASCPDKICVNMYPISEETPGIIVCLPNEVIVELKEE